MALEESDIRKSPHFDEGEGILEEVQKVLNAYGACLIHKQDCMVLAVARPGDSSWRAIAQVRLIAGQVGITPGRIDWRPVEWPCRHEDLNNDGLCRRCGADRRGI